MASSFIKDWVLNLRPHREAESDRCFHSRLRAYKTDTPGLIVHKSIGKAGWVVTHEPSGLWVAHSFAKKDTAVEFANEVLSDVLGDLHTWEDAPDVLRGIDGLRTLVESLNVARLRQEALDLEAAREERTRIRAEKQMQELREER